MTRLCRIPCSLLFALFGSMNFAEVAAQEAESEENIYQLEEMVVVGSRHHARSAAESPVPVEVIPQDDFVNQGYTDMDSMLSIVIPSYNVNEQPVSGSPSLVRPAYLRGLPGDSTLVLVNSKRRHRASVINIFGAGVTDGSHGPDLAPIPAMAIKRLEVLADGASAQYGTDAIAGVLNFILKDSPSGSQLETRWGRYYLGDGVTHTVAGNTGMPLMETGFANFTFEYTKVNPTSRSAQRNDAQALIDRGEALKGQWASGDLLTPEEEMEIRTGENVPVPAQLWGVPTTHYNFKFVGNMGFDLGNGEVYLFTNWGKRKLQQGFWYRYPAGGRFYPTLAVLADGSTFDTRNVFPGGFTPEFGGFATDMSLASGIRGELDNGWTYDYSAVAGSHVTDFVIFNTVNPQLVHLKEDIPTFYKPGGYEEMDYTFNYDMSKSFLMEGLDYPLNVALGLEYRVEEYEIVAGEQNSWFDHSNNPNPPLVNWRKFGIGSDGFPGFNPDFAGRSDRSSYSAYVDLETDLSEAVLVGVAARYENYEDFGDTLNGKLASRWQVNDSIAWRGSLNSGFRVPTVGQVNLVDVTSAFDDQQNLVNNATLPAAHPASIILGAEPLKPETSFNFTTGPVFTWGDIGFTIDFYHIEMKDRISLTRQADLTVEQRAALEAQGAPGGAAIRTVRYFANDFDTTTQGLELVADYYTDRFGGDTNFTFSINWNDTSVESVTSSGIDTKRINQIERNLPKFRGILTAQHQWNAWNLLGRIRYYGEFLEYQADWVGWPIEAGGRTLADLELAYALNNAVSLVLGAQNIFDTYPTENPHARGSGAQYPDSSPYGFSGGFYYLKFKWGIP